MAFQPTPNGVKVEWVGEQNGIPVVNVFHVKAGAAINEALLQDINSIFVDWWTDVVRGGIHLSYSLNQIISTDISVQNGIQVATNLGLLAPGLATGEPAAANAALTLSWRTAQTGRSFRGRTYLGGLPQSALSTAQLVDTPYAQSFALGAIDLVEALEALGHALCILSRVANGVQRISGLLTEIVSVIVDTKIDSQRRRTAN